MAESQPVLFWGFQGTLDHRANLTEDLFHALQLEAPREDQERFVSKRELDEALEQMQRLRIAERRGRAAAPPGPRRLWKPSGASRTGRSPDTAPKTGRSSPRPPWALA